MKFELNPATSRTTIGASLVMAILLSLFLVLSTVNQSVNGVFGSYSDRVALAQYQGTGITQETVEVLESHSGIELIGWASELRQEKRDFGKLASGTGYLIYDATDSFLTVMFPDAKRSAECVLCNSGVAVGGTVAVDTELDLGDQASIGNGNYTVTSTLGSSVRAPQLNDGLFQASATESLTDKNHHVGILFNRLPTQEDIAFVKAALVTESPSSVTVLATQLEDLNTSSVLNLLDRSGELLTTGGLVTIFLLLAANSANDIYSRRALVCSYRSIGAGPDRLRRAVLGRSIRIWLVASAVAIGLIGWIQALAAGSASFSIVPLGIAQVAAVVALSGIALVIGGLIGLSRVLNRDPADVMRALE